MTTAALDPLGVLIYSLGRRVPVSTNPPNPTAHPHTLVPHRHTRHPRPFRPFCGGRPRNPDKSLAVDGTRGD